jgi:hypothetical protein
MQRLFGQDLQSTAGCRVNLVTGHNVAHKYYSGRSRGVQHRRLMKIIVIAHVNGTAINFFLGGRPGSHVHMNVHKQSS